MASEREERVGDQGVYAIEGRTGDPNGKVNAWYDERGFWSMAWTNPGLKPYEFLAKCQAFHDEAQLAIGKPETQRSTGITLTDTTRRGFIDIPLDRFETPDVEEDTVTFARIDLPLLSATWEPFINNSLIIASHLDLPYAAEFIQSNGHPSINTTEVTKLLSDLGQRAQVRQAELAGYQS